MARRERKKLSKTSDAEVQSQKPEAEVQPTPRLALNVLQFCEAYDISEGLYYKLKKQGLGPRETKIGTRTLISFKAADTWFAAREAASGKAATKPARSAKGENANL